MDRISIINDLITKYDFKSYLEIGVRNTSECFDFFIIFLANATHLGLRLS